MSRTPTISQVRQVVREELSRARALPRLMSQADFARFLDVSPATVSRMVARGELETVTVGGLKRVKVPEGVYA